MIWRSRRRCRNWSCRVGNGFREIMLILELRIRIWIWFWLWGIVLPFRRCSMERLFIFTFRFVTMMMMISFCISISIISFPSLTIDMLLPRRFPIIFFSFWISISSPTLMIISFLLWMLISISVSEACHWLFLDPRFEFVVFLSRLWRLLLWFWSSKHCLLIDWSDGKKWRKPHHFFP